jgi:hypothetical protein
LIAGRRLLFDLGVADLTWGATTRIFFSFAEMTRERRGWNSLAKSSLEKL